MEAERQIFKEYLKLNNIFFLESHEIFKTRHIDFLAFDGKELTQYELICSISNNFLSPGRSNRKNIRELIKNKFGPLVKDRLKKAAQQYGNNISTRQVAVIGVPGQSVDKVSLEVFLADNIEVLHFQDIFKDIILKIEKNKQDSVPRILQLIRYVILSKPDSVNKIISETMPHNTKVTFLNDFINDKRNAAVMNNKHVVNSFGRSLANGIYAKPVPLYQILIRRLKRNVVSALGDIIELDYGPKKAKVNKKKDKDLHHFLGNN